MAAGLVLLACAEVYGAVTVAPGSINITRGQASTVTIQYQFTVVSRAATEIITSTSGFFLIPDAVIGTNPVPMTVSVRGTNAVASETVVIPVGIIERALNSGYTSFIYRRTFSNGDTAEVRITIASAAAASFAVQRIELYFENRRAESTIPQHSRQLKAFADIRYAGTGLLEGYWEVDGRVLSRVHQHLAAGGLITLQTPDPPGLPTFDPGTHIVRFVVTNQPEGLPIPAIVYFVVPDESGAEPQEIELETPADGFPVSRATAAFAWKTLAGAALFLVEFYEDTESDPVFSAYTRAPLYLLPERASRELFAPEANYRWKVSGFDGRNRLIAESTSRSFTIR
jgi:hypothetical protein